MHMSKGMRLIYKDYFTIVKVHNLRFCTRLEAARNYDMADDTQKDALRILMEYRSK